MNNVLVPPNGYDKISPVKLEEISANFLACESFNYGQVQIVMANLLLIGLGGFLGALLRYSVSGVVQGWFKSLTFPYGTLAVNLLGCLVIGVLSQVAESRGFISAEARSFVFVGLLGAFTTFSTFGDDTVSLFREGEDLLSYVNVGLHLVLGLSAVWLGRTLAGIPFK